MEQQRHGIRAPLGRISIAGLGAVRATDLSASMSANEITARSGCDPFPWYRDVDSQDLTGSFAVSDFTADIEAAVSGGTLTEDVNDILDRDELVASTNILTLAGNAKLDEDGKLLGVVYQAIGDGEKVLSQLAPDAVPGADSGDFSVDVSNPDQLNVDTASGTYFVTYAHVAAANLGGKVVQVLDTHNPPYVSLLLPFCGVPLEAQSVKRPIALYIPRARILGRDFSAGSGGGDFASASYNWSAVPTSAGVVYEWIFPKQAA